MFRTAKVSEKNPSAVQLRTIRSDLSTIPWLWLRWHKCLKKRNIRCLSTSYCLIYDTWGGPRVTVLLQQPLTRALPRAESLLWMSNPDICPEVPPVNRAGWDCWWAAVHLVSGAPLWPLTDEMKESHPAWSRKGLHQHHISSSVCIKLKSKLKKKEKKIIFTPDLLTPVQSFKQCSFFSEAKRFPELFGSCSFPVTADWCIWLNHLQRTSCAAADLTFKADLSIFTVKFKHF